MAEKSVAEKLMIKPGRSVRFVNAPAEQAALLGEMPEDVRIVEKPGQAVDVTLLFVNNRLEMLSLMPGLRPAIAPDGMLWVIYHKGTSAVKTDINRDSINAYAHSLGLQAVAMISIDEDWSALRLKNTSQSAE